MYDYFRGPDSTGLASIRAEGVVKIAKIASHPLDLFDSKKFVDALSGFHSKALIGHNRLATKGVVNAVNAHPYQFGHIVGAHNGTLDHSSWSALEKAIDEKFDVDSQAIFAAIAKIGIEETVKLLQGAWALVWYDLNENTLNFLRNKERPFWYSYSKEFDRVIWASEWPIIDASLKLSPQTFELYEQENTGYKYWATKENWLYKYDLDALKKGSEERPKPRVKELKGKEPTVVAAAGKVDPFKRTGSMTTYHGTYGATTRLTGSSQNKEVIHLHGNKTNPLGGYITREKFKEIAKYGCSYCSKDVEYGEVGITVIESQDKVLCPDCSVVEGDQSRIYVTDLNKVVNQ